MMPETRRGFGLLAAAVCVFLAALAAIPALADDGTAGIPLPPPPPSDSGGGDGSAGSTSGYPDASQTQAENLFTDNFSATVDSLASDPPDLSGEHPVFLNNKTALISSGAPAGDTVDQIDAALARDQHDGEAAQADVDSILQQARSEDQSPELLASTLPLRTTDDSGQQAPVDLSLDSQANGYAPQNPLVDLTLPDNLSHDVAVGDQGIKLDLGATDPGSATDASADPVAGEGLFYADAAPSTDVVLAPISSGVEALYQLRAPESPNQLQIGLTLPAGASLVGADGGAAAVVRNGSTLATIYPPNAQDAAGTPVPVSMSVNGDSLKLDVDTSAPDLRYPISVDPAIDTYTWSSNGSGTFSDWIQNKTTGSPYQLKTTCTQNVNCTSGTTGPTGLYVAVPQSSSVTAQSVGSWQYRVPHYGQTTAYISHLDLGPMYFANRGDTNANPFLFAGVYDDNGSYVAQQSRNSNALNLYWSLDPGTAKTGKQGVFELWSGVNRQVTQWRDTYLGGATVTLGDRESPVIDGITSSGISFDSNGYSPWVDDATPTINAHADDQDPANANAGLGINRFLFTIPYSSGGGDVTKNLWCTGANASPCPQSADSGSVSYDTSQMPNGVTVIGIVATDAMSNADARIRMVRVDHSAPQIDLSDQLYDSRNQIDHDEFSNLHVDVTDGDSSSLATAQSGVATVEIQVDGQRKDYYSQDCPSGSCDKHVDWELFAPELSSGDHTVKVIATDQLGHESDRSFTVTVGDTQNWDPLPDSGDLVEVAGPDGNALRCDDGQKLMVPMSSEPPDLSAEDAAGDDPNQLIELTSDMTVPFESEAPVQPRCNPNGSASAPPVWAPVLDEPSDPPIQVPVVDELGGLQNPPIPKIAKANSDWVKKISANNNVYCVWAYAEIAGGTHGDGYVASSTENLSVTFESDCTNWGKLKKKHRIKVAWNLLTHHNGKWRRCADSPWGFNSAADSRAAIYQNFLHLRCGHGRYKNRTQSYVYYNAFPSNPWKGGGLSSPGEYLPCNQECNP